MVKYSRSARAVAGYGSRLEYKVLLSLVALFVCLACVLHACIIVCPRIRLCQIIYIKLCCPPFSRSQDRQRFEDPVSKKSECSFYKYYKKKTLTIQGANLLWALILAPYL